MSKNESLSASSLKESLKKEQFNDEITQFKAAIDSNPNDVESRVKLAVVLTEQGESDSAIAHLEDAIKINPNYADAYYELGYIMGQKKGDIEVAISQLQKAIHLNPNEAGYRSMLGSFLEDQNQFSEAISEYQEAIRLDYNYIPSHIALAKALGTIGQEDEAREVLQKTKELFKAKGDSNGLELVELLFTELELK